MEADHLSSSKTPLKESNCDESPEHPMDESTEPMASDDKSTMPPDSESPQPLTNREPTPEEICHLSMKLDSADQDELESYLDGFCPSCTLVPGEVCNACGSESNAHSYSKWAYTKKCRACHSYLHDTFLCPDVKKSKELATFEYQYMKEHNMI